MKAQKQCFECIEKLTRQVLDMSFSQHNRLSSDERESISGQVLDKLKNDFSLSKVPAAIFSQINRGIKGLTGIEDAFLERKNQEIEISRNISSRIKGTLKNDLKSLLLFSAKGNSLDFFKTLEESEKDMLRESSLTIDQSEIFMEKIKKAKAITFFADNSGELFFDLPLLEYLSDICEIHYIVKSMPVQNDLSIKEIKILKDIRIPGTIVTSGNDAVGLEWETLSEKVAGLIRSSDLIIAKGMGYYETFSEISEFKDKVFHLLMAKCAPVAASLKVDLHSYVFTRSG